MTTTATKIQVSLRNVDGNAFAILGRVQSELKRQGHSDLWEEFYADATSGDYNHLLRAITKRFDVTMEAAKSDAKPDRDEDGYCEECEQDDVCCSCFKCGDCRQWAGNSWEDEQAYEEYGVCYECSTDYWEDEEEEDEDY
jgi:hypothetical protein